jgi:NAD-dependent deacetylase
MADSQRELASLLLGARHGVVLTGAGVSTESGIPDFRSPGGVWEKVDPMQVGSLATFISNPERFWSFHRPRFSAVASVEPNPAHLAVAELERRGIIKELITQNIDGLHRRAGSPEPIEVHGTLDFGECLRCRARISREEMLARADDAPDGVPGCTQCSFQIKSGVVLFGEQLPTEAISAAFDAADAADVMLVIGSSLLVTPVSTLPDIVLRHGGALAILTESETPYDDHCTVRLHGKAGVQMTDVLAALDELGMPSTP